MSEPMTILAHAQRLIDAGQYVVVVTEMDRFRGPEVLERKAFKTSKEATAYAQSYNSKNSAASAPDEYIVAHVEAPKASDSTSPDVAKALLRAVELLRDCDRTSTHGQLEADVRQFLASLNLPDAGQGRV